MAKETGAEKNERRARELADPAARATYLRDTIEAVRDGLIRSHNKAFPAGKSQAGPASAGINGAVSDLSEAMDIADLAAHLTKSDSHSA